MRIGRELSVNLIYFLFIAVIFAPEALPGREIESPPFFVLPDNDSVYIMLGKVPRGTEGFNVYRKQSGELDFEKINDEVIKPARDPILFRSMISDEYEWVKKATRGENELQVLRRIIRDPGTKVALSYASTKVAQALGMLFIDREVRSGATYTYRVSFVNFEGKEFQTAEKQCTVRSARIPDPPFEVKAEPGDGNVKIVWKYKPLEPGFDYLVVGFNIYRKSQDQAEFRKINPVVLMWQEDKTDRIDLEVTNGVRYTYYVTAVDLMGKESKPSNYAEATPVDRTPPRIPEGVVAIAAKDRIIVGWRMNLELDLSHYNVFRGRSLEDEFKKINPAPVPADLPYFEDTDVKPGKPFFYRIQAVDKNGNESKLASAVSAVIEDKVPPKPPSDLSAKVVVHMVDLSWKHPGEDDLRGFYIYRGPTKDDWIRINKDPVSGFSFKDKGYRDTGLRPGERYFFGVSAVDSVYNESERVWIEVAIPDDEPPEPPLSLGAIATEDGKVEVFWQGSHSWDVVGYRIYKGEEGKQAGLLVEADSLARRYLDDHVKKGIKHFYYATAFDWAGNESKPTERFYVVPVDLDPPPTPTGIKAIYRGKQGVEISWEASTIDDIAGYRVLRSDSPSGIFEAINPEIMKETRFLDEKGSLHNYYKVLSIDTSGNVSKTSEPVKAEAHQ